MRGLERSEPHAGPRVKRSCLRPSGGIEPPKMPRKDVLGGLPSSKLAEMSALAASERERWLDETLVGCGVVVGGGGVS